MPTDTMKKVVNTCDMSMSEVEKKWNSAKQQAEKQGHGEDWGYITSIFKSMLGDSCLKKLGWKNEKESIMSNTDKLLERIDTFLSEAEIDWDDVKQAAKKTAKKVHGEADDKVINDMIEKIKKGGKAKDTADAIEIIQNMIRS